MAFRMVWKGMPEADEAEMVQNFKMDLEDFVKGTGPKNRHRWEIPGHARLRWTKQGWHVDLLGSEPAVLSQWFNDAECQEPPFEGWVFWDGDSGRYRESMLVMEAHREDANEEEDPDQGLQEAEEDIEVAPEPTAVPEPKGPPPPKRVKKEQVPEPKGPPPKRVRDDGSVGTRGP
ncbi:hypothetical protein AK812_SmicGene17142 [Symbiodinium microadriaticum]|uniref:Uncharacterized protein n=1 Tax=Symbiodinium microadriaticum TaxID=2951 RepID=A0A1Q9DYJ3_SYMMI|nr:hypothetical protein AK812_SmicGene17142 [Symbiodinium microadriaticum]